MGLCGIGVVGPRVLFGPESFGDGETFEEAGQRLAVRRVHRGDQFLAELLGRGGVDGEETGAFIGRARRGYTPVVEVSGKGSGRVSIAGLVCFKPGNRGRLMWSTRLHHNREGERGSFSEDDYIAFLDRAHQGLPAPIVLIWDNNLNTHVSARMRELVAARTWLTVIRQPVYAPDLKPAEGLWRWMNAA